METEIIPWMLTGVVAVVGALSTAVVALFRLQQTATKAQLAELQQQIDAMRASNQILIEEIEECRSDRELLHIENAKLNTRLALLENG